MDNNTLAHRQVHPKFVQANSVSSQAFSVTSQTFKPTPKDDYKLSVYNGEKYNAEQAYDHYIEQGHASAGVMSVLVSECKTEDLSVCEDNIPYDGHAYIDFTGLPNSAIEKKAKKLRKFAVDRGWQHGPV